MSPGGSSGGDGSFTQPWSLATALAGANGGVNPGDTVWVRGGTYRGEFISSLNGTAASLIVVRKYPGERATIDGNLAVLGSYVAVWGLEIMNSAPTSNYRLGVNFKSTGSRLINLVIHDAGASGIGFWWDGAGGEAYGNIIYNNGTDWNKDHGIYANNVSGTKLIADNVIFNNWAYGVHCYTSTDGQLTNLSLDGNVAFGNSTISNPTNTSANLLVGGVAARGIRITNTYFYEVPSTGNWAARIGVYSTSNQDVTVTGNTFVNYVEMGTWSTATVSNDTFYSQDAVLSTLPSMAGYTWSTNTHYRDPSAAAWSDNGSTYSFAGWKSASGLGASDQAPATRPSGVRVVVRPNKYEPGRANIIVYNWAGLPTASVDLAAVLQVGDSFEVRNVQNFYGAPAVTGRYSGGSITVPTAGITPVAPLGRAFTPAPVTGPEFNAFVVLRAGS